MGMNPISSVKGIIRVFNTLKDKEQDKAKDKDMNKA